MSNAADPARQRAEASFKPQAGSDAADGPREAADAARTAEAAKIEKLRALRLAKERSDRIAAEVRKARRQK